MLRIAFALLAGIALELATGSLLIAMVVLLVAAIIGTIVLSSIKDVGLQFRLRSAAGVSLTVAIICFSYILTWFYTDKNYPDYFGNFLRDKNTLTVQISEPPVERTKVIMTVAEVKECNGVNPSGKILLNFSKNEQSGDLAYGDVVLLHSKVEEISGPKNPEEIDFKNYQAYHNLYHRAYLQPGDWKLLERKKGNSLFASVYKLRDSFLETIARYVKDKNNFAVASAIMLGYRDYINADIIRAYSSSGVIHVLSVSGFHVAIMFFMLNLFLQGLDKRGKKWQIAKAVLIISFIWFYACLTGLSSPVLRSALMFTLIQAGEVFSRNKNMYNLVTGSAVVLLLFNPFLLMDVGFQLTYLAVFGIVYLQPRIYALLPLKNWLLDKAWGITAVSIAAQITTVPLSIYYFHQFPNLFLLSNLVVIPLSEFILWAGTVLFAVGHIPFINDLSGWSFNTLLIVLNKFIFAVDGLSFALVKGISITLMELVLVYVLVFLFCWLAEERKTKVLLASLGVIFTLSSFHTYKSISRENQKEIVVYCINKHTAISFISGTTVQYFFDEELKRDTLAIQNKIKPHWWKCGIEREIPIDTIAYNLDFGRMVLFEGKKILIVERTPANASVQDKVKADMVIISNNAPVTIAQLKQLVDFNNIVFDSSNNYKKVANWERECQETKLKYTDVANGAYIAQIP